MGVWPPKTRAGPRTSPTTTEVGTKRMRRRSGVSVQGRNGRWRGRRRTLSAQMIEVRRRKGCVGRQGRDLAELGGVCAELAASRGVATNPTIVLNSFLQIDESNAGRVNQ